MNRHHRHFVSLLVLIVILIRQQRYFRQKIGQRNMFRPFFTPYLAELGNTFQQLLQVLLFTDPFYRPVLKQGTHNTAFFDHCRGHFFCRQFIVPFDKTGNHFPEIPQFLCCSIIDLQGISDRIIQYGPQTDIMLRCSRRQLT